MKTLRRLAALAGVLALCACASLYERGEAKGDSEVHEDCSKVRCETACPAGQQHSPIPPCCRCMVRPV